MLKKENRLKKRYQFNYVYRAGTRFGSKHLTLFVTPSKTKNIKVGLAVTKKVGHATKRNLVKRRLREILFGQLPKLKQSYNIIVMAKETVTDCSFAELSSELMFLLKKSGLFAE